MYIREFLLHRRIDREGGVVEKVRRRKGKKRKEREEREEGGEHQAGGVDQRDGGGLAGLVEPAHKVGVRRVVDEGDHLAGHSGNNLAENGLPDGQTVKSLHGVLQGGHGRKLLSLGLG